MNNDYMGAHGILVIVYWSHVLYESFALHPWVVISGSSAGLPGLHWCLPSVMFIPRSAKINHISAQVFSTSLCHNSRSIVMVRG